MNIVIENVDDGCVGYFKTNINGKELRSDDSFLFFCDVLESLGYNLMFVNTQEVDVEDFE